MLGSSSTTRMRDGGASMVTPAPPCSYGPDGIFGAVVWDGLGGPRPPGSAAALAGRALAASARGGPPQHAGGPPQPPPGHPPERLDHDERGHLRLAGLPVDEADRHLGDG